MNREVKKTIRESKAKTGVGAWVVKSSAHRFFEAVATSEADVKLQTF